MKRIIFLSLSLMSIYTGMNSMQDEAESLVEGTIYAATKDEQNRIKLQSIGSIKNINFPNCPKEPAKPRTPETSASFKSSKE